MSSYTRVAIASGANLALCFAILFIPVADTSLSAFILFSITFSLTGFTFVRLSRPCGAGQAMVEGALITWVLALVDGVLLLWAISNNVFEDSFSLAETVFRFAFVLALVAIIAAILGSIGGALAELTKSE